MRLDIKHKTRIQLDHDLMKRVLARHFLRYGLDDKVTFDPDTGKGLYITYKLLKNPADAFEEYQKKKAALVGGPSNRSIRIARQQTTAAAAERANTAEPGARTPVRRRPRNA